MGLGIGLSAAGVGGGGGGKVTPEMLLEIYRKDRQSEIKHFENEFG